MYSSAEVPCAAGSTRNPRRLSIPSRVVIGLDESFVEQLQSDEDIFFGSGDEGVSDEGGANSPAGEEQGAEEARLACDDWSSDEEVDVQETAAPAAAAAEHLTDVDVTEEEISAMQGILDKGCGCAHTEYIRPLPAEDLALHKKKFLPERKIGTCADFCQTHCV